MNKTNRIIKSKNTVDLAWRISGKKTLCSDEIRDNRKLNNKIRHVLGILEDVFIFLVAWWVIFIILAVVNKIFLIPEEAYWNESYEVNDYTEIIKQLELNNKDFLEKHQQDPEIVAITVPEVEKVFDINRLAKAVAMAETANCTKWYWATHNNCFGIKHWNTAPCPWVPKMAMCKYDTPEESYEAFKIIWTKWYWELPNYEMAKRWSWDDRTWTWRTNVLHFYNKWI